MSDQDVIERNHIIAEKSAELDRLRRELAKRAKQLGVACDKHDLTHALACGHCLADVRRELAEREQAHAFLVEVNNSLHGELAEARELLREARDRIGCGCVGGSDEGLCCVCEDRLARIDAAMAAEKEVPR